MSTLFYHRVEISDGTGIIRHADGFLVSEVAVVAESEKQIVVAGAYGMFVVIRKAKVQFDTCLDKEYIGIDTHDSVWGNRVTYTLYSYKKKRATSIRKAIEAEIKRKFGFFVNGIDLSCITDTATGSKA